MSWPAMLLANWAQSRGSARSCSSWTPALVRQAMEATLEKAHESFGGERMGEIISWMPSEVRADVERDGFAKWCFEAAPRLRAEGLSFGFNGPSFDCSRASSATEHLLCDDAILWGPDREISAHYSVHRDRATSELKARLKDTQRSWIAWRDGVRRTRPASPRRIARG